MTDSTALRIPRRTDSTARTEALRYLDAGLSVVPIKADGSKGPCGV